MKRLIWVIVIVVLAVIAFHFFSTHIHKNKTANNLVNKVESLAK